MSSDKVCPIRLIAWNMAVSADLNRQAKDQHNLASMTGMLVAGSTPNCIGRECAMWHEGRECCGLKKGV